MAPVLKTNIKVYKQCYFAFQRPGLQVVSDDLIELDGKIISYPQCQKRQEMMHKAYL